MIKLARQVAAAYMRRLLRGRNKGRVASVMEKAFDEYDELVDAMGSEPELMGDVLESLVNLGDISYHDGAFYYKDSTRLASKRTMLADQEHKQSIALMRFLSDVATRHRIGDHVYVVGGAVRNFVIDRPIKDIDVVIDSVKAGKDSEWFAKQLKKAIPAKTSLQTNQYGVAILSVNESWKVDGEELQGEVIEIANARKESYGGEGGKGYKPHMVEPSTIEEDVKRREFTFNCMVGSTLVPTEHGLLRMDEIASRKDGDQQGIDLVVAGKSGPSQAIGWQYSGRTDTLRVKTEWGHVFECTHHHPVLVLRGLEHEWVQADQLREGDMLCVNTHPMYRETPLELNLPEPPPESRKELRKPEIMSPDLAFVLGCIVAEGSFSPNRTSFCNGDKDLIRTFCNKVEAVFGMEAALNQTVTEGEVRSINGREVKASRDCYDVILNSKTLVQWLEHLGLYCGGPKEGRSASHHKVVPWSILQADAESQAAFLAAYLEGDGSIRETGMMVYLSASDILLQQLQIILGAHGIVGKVKDRFLYVHQRSAADLWAKISPYMVTKGSDALFDREFKSRNRFGIPKENVFAAFEDRKLFSNRNGTFFQTDSGGTVSFSGWTKEVVPQVTSRVLYDAYEEGLYDAFLSALEAISPDRYRKVRQLLDLRYHYVEVVSVESAGVQDVYDLSMAEGVEPAFVANGVVVHNTLLWQLSQLAHGPDEAEIIDLTGCGLDDLEEGVMKCPSDPDKTFSDDPTRMLRAVKFMVKYGFEIHRIVEKAIRRNARKLKKAPHNAISDILVNDILEMSQSRETLDVLDDLGLLDVIKDMLEDSKPFRKTLLNWAKRNAEVMFLFDMMDIGLPLHSRFRFLDKAQTARLRTISVELGNREADKFLDLLKQPGRQMDTGELIKEFELQGREVKKLMDVARDVLLEQPALRKSPRNLTEAVKNKFRKVASVRIASDYYRPTGNEDLEEVARMWAEEGKQARGSKVHGHYSVRELWPLREYTWTRDKARSGLVETDNGIEELPGPQKWDHIKADMEKNGWRDDRQPLILVFGKDGNVKVTEGNHRLAIAREIGLRKIPVKFMFYKRVNNGKSLV